MTTAVKLPKSKVTVFGPPRCHQKWKEDQKKQDEKSMCGARIIMRMGWDDDALLLLVQLLSWMLVVVF